MIRRRSLSLALLIGLPLVTQGQQINMENMDVYLHIINSRTELTLQQPAANTLGSEKFQLLMPRRATPSSNKIASKSRPIAPHYTSRPIMF